MLLAALAVGCALLVLAAAIAAGRAMMRHYGRPG